MAKKIIVWLRNDLRIRDNEILFRASEKGMIYPVYCLDPRQFQKNALNLPKTGSFRAEFLLTSLANLRKNLKNLGCDLIIRQGLPEKIIPQLATSLQADAVYASKEVTQEELSAEASLEKKLLEMRVPLELFWQSTLLHIDDIPWPINNLPDIFTQFRKEAERGTPIRKTYPTPTQLNPIDEVDPGNIPTLEGLNISLPPPNEKGVLNLTGGEDAAWERLQTYIWEGDYLKAFRKSSLI